MKISMPLTLLATVAPFVVDAAEVLQFDRNGEHERPVVVRNYISHDAAKQIYKDLRDVGFPTSQDEDIHPSLMATHGHAGEKMENPPLAHEAMEHVYRSDSNQSVVFRLEHLKEPVYDQSKELVNELVPNNVMEDGGTIHVYVSSPGAAALANHTDTTDIFVLHLDGAKEWLLCEEREEDLSDPFVFSLTHKLSSCSTYQQKEIDTLKCHHTTLYPGDALFLPMRVVHSAHAVSDVPSAHLTFGFFKEQEDGMCQESYSDEFNFDAGAQRRNLACKRCDRCDGCDSLSLTGWTSCDWSCDGSCNEASNCDSDCDKWNLWVGSSCDTSCDTGC